LSASKREEIRARRRRNEQRQRNIMLAMAVGGALIIAAALIVPSLTPVEITEIEPKTINARIDGTSIGEADAPVQIDVWEDFQCPACARYSSEIESQVITTFVEAGLVLYTFHHYPFIDSQSATKESQQAANASMCAMEQGRFWDFKDILFANWNGENLGAFSDKRLLAFADSLNLDMVDFKACFNENRYEAEIAADYQAGLAIGVSGTPSVFVNGVQLTPGYVPGFEDISNAVNAALDGQ